MKIILKVQLENKMSLSLNNDSFNYFFIFFICFTTLKRTIYKHQCIIKFYNSTIMRKRILIFTGILALIKYTYLNVNTDCYVYD